MKRVFISHKEKLPWLKEFCEFLEEVIGIRPILLEDQPVEKGMAPRQLAEYYMKQCDCVLFLLTRDMQSTSVPIEIEIAKNIFPLERRFYMLEVGVEFPPLAEETTYIQFPAESLKDVLSALVKLSKNFKAARLLPKGMGETAISTITSAEQLFVLENLADMSNRSQLIESLFDSYRQKFNKRRKDFNILINQLRQKSFVSEGYLTIPTGFGTFAKVTQVEITSKGLEVLGTLEDRANSKKAVEFIEGLREFGLKLSPPKGDSNR